VLLGEVILALEYLLILALCSEVLTLCASGPSLLCLPRCSWGTRSFFFESFPNELIGLLWKMRVLAANVVVPA